MTVKQEDVLVSELLQALAQAIDETLIHIIGKRMGFALTIFNTEEVSRMNYVSNCNREEVMAVFKILLKGWEQGMPDVPSHKVN